LHCVVAGHDEEHVGFVKEETLIVEDFIVLRKD